MNEIEIPSAIEPTEWFVVFHVKSLTRWLGWITVGRYKHVSAFGYCVGVKLWLLYDVQWSGTRVMLLDKASVMRWTDGCMVLKITRTGARMRWSSRLGFTCVNAVKHLIGLQCVAATPDQLYRHIIRNGGTVISEQRLSAPAAGRP